LIDTRVRCRARRRSTLCEGDFGVRDHSPVTVDGRGREGKYDTLRKSSTRIGDGLTPSCSSSWHNNNRHQRADDDGDVQDGEDGLVKAQHPRGPPYLSSSSSFWESSTFLLAVRRHSLRRFAQRASDLTSEEQSRARTPPHT